MIAQALSGYVAAILVLLGAPPGASAAGSETRTCAEGSDAGATRFEPARDLRAGPLVFFEGNGRATKARVRRSLYSWKVPVIVDAGRRVSVTVARGDRDVASLVGSRRARRLDQGRTTLRYHSCSAGTSRATGWGGAILTRGRRLCLRLDVEAEGEAVHRVVMPLGRRRCRA